MTDQLIRRSGRHPSPLRTIVDLASRASGEDRDLESLFRVVCEHVVEAVAFERAVAYQLVGTEEVVPVARCGPGGVGEAGGRRLRVDERPELARAHASRRPDAAHDRIVVPLFSDESCLGFVVCDRPRVPADVNANELELLEALGTVAGTILGKAVEVERLRRTAELEGHFIALASHELRGPAGVIQGLAATLHERGGELTPEQIGTLHGALSAQAAHLARLVHQLLDLSRLDANAIQLHTERFAVREHVEQVVRLVAADRLGDVDIEVPDDLETVADPAAVERILANLVSNAFRYGRPPVRICAQQLDRHFRLVVEDRGAGIAAEFVPHLFERFTRSSPEQDGTGLGLAIARSYAHAHGGELLYEAATPTGARFELVLPAQHRSG